MVAEYPNQQSTTGKLASGYIKTAGYTNIIGVVIMFIVGGLMVLGGIGLSFLFGSFFPLIFSGIGLLIIFLGRLGSKVSKRMREGKYYRVGQGWIKPE
ncbi:MAG: hypothetical protein KJ905_03725 [Nanoarchaeota archaeon]|nr:hypothetical protein [Nanoarchaeota archaeon]MBU1501850.1 hypothetical protein [Nanoarchaeota archaeon]MBU2459218.1 hypothetical protein [Nanoarchaeota archaeon]